MNKSLEERVKELEKKIAALENRVPEQLNNDFANYLLKCVVYYQSQMSKTNRYFRGHENQSDEV